VTDYNLIKVSATTKPTRRAKFTSIPLKLANLGTSEVAKLFKEVDYISNRHRDPKYGGLANIILLFEYYIKITRKDDLNDSKKK
jgi:hypothetical protein